MLLFFRTKFCHTANILIALCLCDRFFPFLFVTVNSILAVHQHFLLYILCLIFFYANKFKEKLEKAESLNCIWHMKRSACLTPFFCANKMNFHRKFFNFISVHCLSTYFSASLTLTLVSFWLNDLVHWFLVDRSRWFWWCMQKGMIYGNALNYGNREK